ncbi:MAG: hypothetical protein ACXABL_05805 [Candidatus Thorarchaeota archaeon]|jgi:hypothetical protein
MVRITTISNLLSGIGLSVSAPDVVFYTWIVGAGLLVLVILMSGINTFTEMTGFVHPEDKLVSNMFVFLMAIATILIYGLLGETPDLVLQQSLFNMASMIVIAYVFLFIFVFFSSSLTEGGDTGQVKEMTARFMLVSLFLGAIMAGIKVGLDWIWVFTNSYELAAATLGIFAVVLVFLIVAFLGRKYEPVGE